MCVTERHRPRKEKGREKKEAKRQRESERGGRRRGRDAETSRTGKITHFDGIKMSVFPSPISMEIAHLWRAKERKGRREEGKEERGATNFCLSYSLCVAACQNDGV